MFTVRSHTFHLMDMRLHAPCLPFAEFYLIMVLRISSKNITHDRFHKDFFSKEFSNSLRIKVAM